MKRIIAIIGVFMALAVSAGYAQKYALIDMEYILKKIPAYESANQQLEGISKQWQSEIDKETKAVDELYKKYQADLVFLAGEEKTKRENEIVTKENAIQSLQNKYFGPEGELFKRREALIKPIQDNIYTVVKDISTASGYMLVIDRASATSVIFASPGIDISDEVLSRLGY
ncbi:MAG TPA: hypothetical protein DDZ96_12910 [Porphyromonadaceae bacterium]|jgi:outer membrane protein|uniref:OmpH family outer membrane protein n=1 Tax=Limibacterium fermenti TaxID=3229863 RepID=UPI000E841336|nr:hypothetical protein [Porphyromonadaceae bacterium]HBK31999.1 hypothetical protein [Porphyromonadaceae bacterium]HBL34694.1 hypothetical protein [Porphyromonadaceae bacterium]HBX21956.1 hypothetical protein [Porphyromonadaceae bacterium]HBX45934.1 hypothetical protein [Porphyromonadaceae bacterium]